MLRFLTAALAVLLFAATAQAGKVKTWHHHAPAHFEKAKLSNAVVTNEGALRLARQLRPLADVEATHVWDVVEDRSGNLYLATGEEGKILKVAADGKVTTFHATQDSQVLCLALAPDGSLYAGTGPKGTVLRLSPQGERTMLYQSPEAYVWSLALDAAGKTVYAGTGPKGRIYEITGDGKGRIFYATKQEHVLSLAAGPGGFLYAGVDRDGLVYRVDGTGKGFVLMSAPQGEVRSLLATADGIYAGTSSPRRRGMTGPGTGRVALSGPATVQAVPTSTSRTQSSKAEKVSTPGGSSASAESSERGSPAPTAPPPTVGENSLYRIAPDGTVREIFREKALLLSLLRQNGRIFIGTGMEGQLFEVDEATKERCEVARLDHGQIHCLVRRHDGSIVLGAGDPGKLYVLEDRYCTQGTVTSEVLDAKLMSKWGALRWQADAPEGTRVTLAVRSGNTPEPNDTWSDWSAEQGDAQQATAAAPTARFLQYRVTLSSANPERTPSVHNLTILYLRTNQAPEVTNVTVPDLDGSSLDNPKKLRLKWAATDPNEDDLTYSLYVRKEGWKNWVQLEDNLDKTDYEWDTTTTPSGLYQLKVVACDRKDNPAEECLQAERTSAPFIVAHEPPAVSVKTTGMDGDQAVIEAAATDPLARLTAASFSLNGKKWVNVFPTDGLFDTKTETFKFKTESLRPGTYVLVLRVRDAAGNVGSGDVVFTVKNKITQE